MVYEFYLHRGFCRDVLPIIILVIIIIIYFNNTPHFQLLELYKIQVVKFEITKLHIKVYENVQLVYFP